MAIFIQKRDGRMVEYDFEKIKTAIDCALKEVGDRETNAERVAKKVENSMRTRAVLENANVEDIQNEVERTLMEYSPHAAKAYILYREQRNRERNFSSQLYRDVISVISPEENETSNDNANVDDMSFGGRKFGASGVVHKEIGKSMMDPRVRKAFEDMWLYIHDMDSYDVGMNNCLQVDMEHQLKNGFSTRNTDVRPANSFATATQLVAVIFQCQSQGQFGGVGSAHIDYDLAPYVALSFKKHFANALEDVYEYTAEKAKQFAEKAVYHEDYDKMIAENDCGTKGLGVVEIGVTEYERAWKTAHKRMEREGKQATEGFFHNLNTLESRPGRLDCPVVQ